MPSTKYLLVGGGLASAEAAKQIRRLDASGPITLVSDERQLPYNRPPLSKEYLRSETKDPLDLVAAETYVELSVETVLGAGVRAIDPKASTATLENGEVYRYERLLLATGGSPVRLGVPGYELSGVHYLRTKDDAEAIKRRCKMAKRAVVVGAGFIGLEVAASLIQMGLEVTVVEQYERVWPRFADAKLASYVQQLCEKHRISVLTGRKAARFDGTDGNVNGVLVDTGERIDCDLVVVGVGIRPNVELADNAGLDVDDGVVVDKHMRTSSPNIFAAGDVANYFDPTFTKRRRVEHWGHAEYSGQVAGMNMAGEEMTYDLLTYIWSDIFDVHLEAAGDEHEFDSSVIRGEVSGGSFVVLYLKNQRMTAYFSVNTAAREFPVFQRLIKRKKDLAGRLKELADPEFNVRDLLK